MTSKKVILAALAVVVFAVAGTASAFSPYIFSTNTVTHTVYSTSTVTTTAVQPVETLTTVTTSGTQVYTTTAVATADNDIYAPPYMYFTWSNNTGFWRQAAPWSATSSGGDTVTESATGYASPPYTGSVSMSITQVSAQYNDLGFYYEFQNLNLGWLATSGNSIDIAATGNWGVNLWLNPAHWTWGPSANPNVEAWNGLGSDGSYGIGPGSTATITSTTSFMLQHAAGTCSTGTNVTPASLISTCGLSASTPFALWIGVGPVTAGNSVSATITQVTSTPYP